MKKDDAVADIRRVREEISRENDFDPHKLIQHYMQRQKSSTRKLRKSVSKSSLRHSS